MGYKTLLWFVAIMFFLIWGANAQPNEISCESLTDGQLLCRTVTFVSYEPAEALRIASQLKAKASTIVTVDGDSLEVRYEGKDYFLFQRAEVIAATKSVRDMRNYLIAALGRKE